MSGGTFDYAEVCLPGIADEIRHRAEGYVSDDMYDGRVEHAPDLPLTAAVLAPIVDEVWELLRRVDRHYAGDSALDDEALAVEARARLLARLAVRS